METPYTIHYPEYFRETSKYYRRKALKDDLNLAADVIEKQNIEIEQLKKELQSLKQRIKFTIQILLILKQLL